MPHNKRNLPGREYFASRAPEAVVQLLGEFGGDADPEAELIAGAVGFYMREIAYCQFLETPGATGVDSGKNLLIFHVSDIGSAGCVRRV